MLVLSRHKEESIVIGHDIILTIVEIRGDKVRIGIDAPKDVSVHRREVYDAIQRTLSTDTHDRPDAHESTPLERPVTPTE